MVEVTIASIILTAWIGAARKERRRAQAVRRGFEARAWSATRKEAV